MKVKVQAPSDQAHSNQARARAGLLPAALVVALIAAPLVAGCGGEDPPAPSTDENAAAAAGVVPVDERFGAPYEVVLGRAPADPDVPPALVGDTLVALVAYPGGCADHDFRLRDDADGDTLRLWIVHDAGGDDCEAYLHDEVRLPAPADARDARAVVLLNPQGGPPFVVGRASE